MSREANTTFDNGDRDGLLCETYASTTTPEGDSPYANFHSPGSTPRSLLDEPLVESSTVFPQQSLRPLGMQTMQILSSSPQSMPLIAPPRPPPTTPTPPPPPMCAPDTTAHVSASFHVAPPPPSHVPQVVGLDYVAPQQNGYGQEQHCAGHYQSGPGAYFNGGGTYYQAPMVNDGYRKQQSVDQQNCMVYQVGNGNRWVPNNSDVYGGYY